MTADAESVTISSLNYSVTFYMYFSRSGGLVFNGIRIKGWPDNDDVERVLDAWNQPRLTQEYESKMAWLTDNPGFKVPVVRKAPQKRVYASQVE